MDVNNLQHDTRNESDVSSTYHDQNNDDVGASSLYLDSDSDSNDVEIVSQTKTPIISKFSNQPSSSPSTQHVDKKRKLESPNNSNTRSSGESILTNLF